MTRAAILVLALVLAAACDREERRFDPAPTGQPGTDWPPQSNLHAGLRPDAPQAPPDYVESAWMQSEGKRLYAAFNCVGCHAHGGGGMGPPLMDSEWIYGHQPLQIYETITQGRPNGMPAFRGKISDIDVWKLVVYVRSLSGLVDKSAVSARDDHLMSTPPATLMDTPTPVRREGLAP